MVPNQCILTLAVWMIPKLRLLRIADVERVFGMTCLAQPQMKQGLSHPREAIGDRSALIAKGAVGPPSTDNLICPGRTVEDRIEIIGSDRIISLFHVAGIRRAKGKDIGGAEPTKPKRPSPPFTALDRRVVLHFGCGGGIEHHKHHPIARSIPDAGQAVSVTLTVRIDCGRWGIALGVGACDHGIRGAGLVPGCQLGAGPNTGMSADKHPTWVQLTGFVLTHSDCFPLVRGPSLFAVFHIRSQYHAGVAVAQFAGPFRGAGQFRQVG